jgi:acyl carrier protein
VILQGVRLNRVYHQANDSRHNLTNPILFISGNKKEKEIKLPTILERVKKVTVARLSAKEEAVIPSANFTDDLGADSLDLVELIMGLEEEFSTPAKPVKIPDEEAAKIKTVQDAVDYLNKKGMSDADVNPQPTQSAPPVAKATSAAPKTTPKAISATEPQKKAAAPAVDKPAPTSTKTVKNTKTK